MLAVEWIDRVKRELKIKSDYAVAMRIGLSRQAVSHIRRGHVSTLSTDSCIAVAALLGLDPEEVAKDQAVEAVRLKCAGFAIPALLPFASGLATAAQYILCSIEQWFSESQDTNNFHNPPFEIAG